jgi:hypothetical protein
MCSHLFMLSSALGFAAQDSFSAGLRSRSGFSLFGPSASAHSADFCRLSSFQLGLQFDFHLRVSAPRQALGPAAVRFLSLVSAPLGFPFLLVQLAPIT